jgi:hypothetical protein
LFGHDSPYIYENVGSVTRPESTIHSIFKAKHQTKKRLPFPKKQTLRKPIQPKNITNKEPYRLIGHHAFFGSCAPKLSAGFLAYGSKIGCAFSCRVAQWT